MLEGQLFTKAAFAAGGDLAMVGQAILHTLAVKSRAAGTQKYY